jgi:cytosine/adenosine deaminase-related metal-dependent hydrolase
MKVGLGCDGSASNDTGNLLQEARLALLAARARGERVEEMTVRQALEIATIGGAQVLGRDDIGSLAVGMSADFIAVDLERTTFVGAEADPVAALVLCDTGRVDYSFVNGRRVVDRRRITTLDHDDLVRRGHQAAVALHNA